MNIEVIRIGGPTLEPVNEFSGLMESVLADGLANIDALPDEVLARILGEQVPD